MTLLLNNNLAAIVIATTLIVASFMGVFYAGFQRGWRAAWKDMQKSVTSTRAAIPDYDASGKIPVYGSVAVDIDKFIERTSIPLPTLVICGNCKQPWSNGHTCMENND